MVKRPVTPPTRRHAGATFDYVVKPGDNLWQIATDRHESLGAIEAENPGLRTNRGFDLIWAAQHVKVHPGARFGTPLSDAIEENDGHD